MKQCKKYKQCKHKNSYCRGHCSFGRICEEFDHEMYQPNLRTQFIQWLKGWLK